MVYKLMMILELTMADEQEAEAIERSMAPDNIKVPSGIELRIEKEGKMLRVIVSGGLERLLTVKNTIEDIFISLYPVLRETMSEG